MAGEDTLQGADWVAGNFNSGVLPATNDRIIIPSTLNANVTDTGGNAQAIDLDLLKVMPGFTGLFGTSGSPIQTAADRIEIAGSSGFYFECDGDSGVGGFTTDLINVRCANANTPVELGSCDISGSGAADGPITEIQITMGNVLLKANAEFSSSKIVLQPANFGDARLTIASNADTLEELDLKNGYCEANNALTLVYIEAGAVLTQDNAAITTAHVRGTLNLNYGGGSALTTVATTIYLYEGGTVNMYGDGTKDLFKTVGTLVKNPKSTLLRDTTLHAITTFEEYGI